MARKSLHEWALMPRWMAFAGNYAASVAFCCVVDAVRSRPIAWAENLGIAAIMFAVGPRRRARCGGS